MDPETEDCTGTHECGCAAHEELYRRLADEDGIPVDADYF